MELSLDSKVIKKYEAPIDAFLIPIKDNDILKKDFDCFKFDYNYLNGYQQYLGNETFLGEYALEEDITFTRGEIKKIFNNYEFEHNMDTDHGASGSPVILYENLNVIGIHKAGKKIGNNNIGTFIGKIIEEMQKDQNNEIKSFHNNKNDIISNNINNINQNNNDKSIDMNCSSICSTIINQENLLVNNKQVGENTKESKKKELQKKFEEYSDSFINEIIEKEKICKKIKEFYDIYKKKEMNKNEKMNLENIKNLKNYLNSLIGILKNIKYIYIPILGLDNSAKITILNALIGQKLFDNIDIKKMIVIRHWSLDTPVIRKVKIKNEKFDEENIYY